MLFCSECNCRLYDDFGLGLYDFETGSSICPEAKDGYHRRDREMMMEDA